MIQSDLPHETNKSFTQRVARIHDLDMQHQTSVHQMDLSHRDEATRVLKLRILSMRDQIASLKESALEKDNSIEQLAQCKRDSSAQMQENKTKIDTQNKQLVKFAKQLKDLQVNSAV